MVMLKLSAYTLCALLIVHSILPPRVDAGMKIKMMKGGGMMGGGGGGGVMELLVAGIVAKLLGDMKNQKGGSMGMTKYVPVPIFVQSDNHMMMDSGWDSGMMMNSGWKGGMMMNSGWKGGMMNNGWKGGMMMGGD